MRQSKRFMVTASLMAAMFMAAVEATIVNAAMPTVVGTLGGISLYSWVFTAFMLTNTVTVPIYGKLADLYGRKKVFMVAILLFIGGSALCGFSNSMKQLVLFRGIQGLGAGGVLPVAMTIVGDIFPFELRAKVQGWFSSVWGLAAIVGPFIGGWTVDHFSWRWIFWFNLPLGLIIILVIAFFLTEHSKREHKKVDYVGASLFVMAILGLLSFTQVAGGNQGTLSFIWIIPVASLLLFLLFFLWERKVADPFIPLNLFRNPMIASSNLTAFLSGMGMFGAISFVPLFVQGVLGHSPTLAGLAITPQVLGWSIASVIAGRWLLKKGYRPPILTGVFMITLAAVTFSFMSIHTPYPAVLGGMFLLGLGLGLSMTSYIIAVQSAVKSNQRGAATSSQMFSRSLGGVFGVTLLGTVMSFQLKGQIQAYITQHQQELSPQIIKQLEKAQGITNPEELAKFPAQVAKEMQEFLTHALNSAFITAAFISLTALMAAFFFVPKGSARSLSVEESEKKEREGT